METAAEKGAIKSVQANYSARRKKKFSACMERYFYLLCSIQSAAAGLSKLTEVHLCLAVHSVTAGTAPSQSAINTPPTPPAAAAAEVEISQTKSRARGGEEQRNTIFDKLIPIRNLMEP